MNTTAGPTTDAPTDTAPRPHGRHVVLRHRMTTDGAGLLVLGCGFFLAVLLLTGTVSVVADEIRISGWETGTQVVRWFVGAMGVYFAAVYLPLYVTHGRTRREVAVDLGIFVGIYALLVAVVITIGFGLETVVYRLAGWTQGLENVHLFDDPGQYHLVFVEHAVVSVVWLTAGAMLGAAFYRNGTVGAALLPVALAAVMATEAGTGPGYFGPLPPPLLEHVGLELGAFTPLGAVATALCLGAVLGAVTWGIVRDVPIRSETP